jgi:hypothetical protein
VVEYTGLENRHTVKGIWGSNPCLSAKADKTHSNCRDASSHYALLPFSITVVRQFLVLLVVVRIHEGQLKLANKAPVAKLVARAGLKILWEEKSRVGSIPTWSTSKIYFLIQKKCDTFIKINYLLWNFLVTII